MNDHTQTGDMMPVLDDLLEQADTLPAFPDIVTDILSRIDSPNSAPDDFTDMISRDPVLTGKVLKFANSAFYGYSKEIVNLKEAIILLGLDTLKSIVLAISSFSVFKTDVSGYGLKRDELYRHSLTVASLARSFAEYNGMHNIEKYFICGLLHDVGKLLLGSYISKYKKQIQMKLTDGTSLIDIEKELTGFNHCLVGGELAKFWNLPELLVQVNLFHHNAKGAPASYRGVVQIIEIANLLSELIQAGSAYTRNLDWFKTVNHIIEIDKKDFDNIIKTVRNHVFNMTGFI